MNRVVSRWRGMAILILIVPHIAWAEVPGTPRTSFKDDFRADSRPSYQVSGSVDWKAGRFVLGRGSSLARALASGPVAEYSVRWHPGPTGEGSPASAEFGLIFEGGLLAIVSLQEGAGNRPEGKLMLTQRVVKEGKPADTRLDVAALPAGPPSGNWTVKCQHGLIQVARGNEQFARGFILTEGKNLRGFFVLASGREVECREIRFNADPRGPALDPAVAEAVNRANGESARREEESDFRAAAVAAEQVWRLLQKHLGDLNYFSIRSLSRLGALEAIVGDPSAGLHTKKAYDDGRRLFGEEHPVTTMLLATLAEQRRIRGDLRGALADFETVLAIRTRVLGPSHALTADAMHETGVVLQARGDHATAQERYQAALKIRRKSLGDGHPQTIVSLAALGDLLRERGRHELSRIYLEEVVELRRRANEAGRPDVASALIDLGGLLQDMGEPEAARRLTEEAVSLRRQALGEGRPETAAALVDLGICLRRQGKLADARGPLEAALATRRKALGKQSHGVANSLYHLGRLEQDLWRPAAARAAYEEALAINRALLGNEHSTIGDVLNQLGNACRHQGDYAAARRAHEEALAIRRKVLGDEHVETARSWGNLGMTLHDQGHDLEAIRALEKTLTIWRKTLGAGNPDLAWALNGLGNSYVGLRRYTEAQAAYKEALAIWRRARGDEHPDVATAFDNLGNVLHHLGRNVEALGHLKRAEAVRRKALGPDHPDTAWSLIHLANAYRSLADYAAARAASEEALAVRRKALGEDHPDTATAMENLANLLTDLGRLVESVAYAEKVLAIRLKVLGAENRDTAWALDNLGNVLQLLGRNVEALGYLKRADAVRRNVLGPDHPDLAWSLIHIANAHYDLAEYAAARTAYEEALMVRRKSLGEDHPDTATAMETLANLETALEHFSEAQTLLDRSLAVRRKVQGANHPDVAGSLNGLGYLYGAQGDSVRAREAYGQALAIRRNSLGENHPDTAWSLSNMSSVLIAQGDLATARSYCQRALAVRRKVRGDRHPDTADSLVSLAFLSMQPDNMEAGMELLVEALTIYREVYGQRHPKTLSVLTSIDSFSKEKHNRRAAHEAYLELTRSLYGEDHTSTAWAYFNLALGIHVDLLDRPDPIADGRPKKILDREGTEAGPEDSRERDEATARTFLERSVAIYRKIHGERNDQTIIPLTTLAMLQKYHGQPEAARRTLEQIIPVQLEKAENLLGWLSEAESLAYSETWLGRMPILAIMRELPGITPEQAYAPVWTLRALATRALAQRRAPALGDTQARATWDRLQSTRRQLAQLTLSPTSADRGPARQQALTRLNEEKEELEHTLARLSATFRRERQALRAGYADLARLLPPGVAVVDVVGCSELRERSEYDAGSRWVRYEAFVLRRADDSRGYTLAWEHLGLAGPIAEAAGRWRRAIARAGGDPGTPPGAGKDTPAERPEWTLRHLVWEKIEPHLAGCSTVIVIPDGPLTQIPWAALPGKSPESYLIDEFAIGTVSHAHRLVELLGQARPQADGGLLLVGRVAYDAAHAPGAGPPVLAKAAKLNQRGPAIDPHNRPIWGPLGGTGAEVDAIAGLWPTTGSVFKFEHDAASEAALREHLPRSRFVHLATHGFFADAAFRSAFRHDYKREVLLLNGQEAIGRRATVTGRNPLILSGIVLAGANTPPATDEFGAPLGEDGIMTAEEVAGLDLGSTELVVLSACETGLGDVAGGEGIFGLQRAFGLAGARTVVASLWKIDDAATQALMTEFYRNLWRQSPALGKLEALRRAQQAMLRNYDPGLGRILRGPRGLEPLDARRGRILPPFYWAAFTLDGDWR